MRTPPLLLLFSIVGTQELRRQDRSDFFHLHHEWHRVHDMGPGKVVWVCMSLSSQLAKQSLLVHFHKVENKKAKSETEMNIYSVPVFASFFFFEKNKKCY